jgi:hypothetical protein
MKVESELTWQKSKKGFPPPKEDKYGIAFQKCFFELLAAFLNLGYFK